MDPRLERVVLFLCGVREDAERGGECFTGKENL